MIYERFEISLIIPFGYNTFFYEKIGTEEDIRGEQYFQRKLIRSNRLNVQNEKLWKNEEQGPIRCLELRQQYRKDLGLHTKENWTYRLENREDISFKISKVNGWFFKSGEGYLTLHIRADGLEENQVLDLRAMLRDVKAEKKIYYTIKTGRDKTADVYVTLKDLIRNFLLILRQMEPETQRETFMKAMSLSYGIVEELDPKMAGIYFEKLRLHADGNSRISEEIDSQFLYKPEKYPYINWVISDDALAGTADIREAQEIAEKNGNFLREGLGPSIFQNYLMVYLYYISLNIRTEQLEKQSREAENNMCVYPAMRTIRHVQQQFVMLTDQFHINTLFYRYLCSTVWKIPERLERLEETSENDVFISYRRLYGGYPARLLYNKLKESGCKVFYDHKSMRAGDFEIQLEKEMKRGMYVIAVLTPGCLEERTAGEKDYMIKELRRAMNPDNHISVINVFVDGFSFPKQMPKGLEGLDTQHGIYMNAENLDSALERVAEVLRRS